MKAVICKELGPADKLVVMDVPSPEPDQGEVKIAVHAAGVNFADTLAIRGQYQTRFDPPFTPGMEVAGTVTALGQGVANLKVGDRVMAVPGFGAFAEEVVLNAQMVMPIPAGMDFAEAAGFPVAYGTSHLALSHRGRLKAGETLLVLGASGGVGLTAVEIGKTMGATVIAAASSPDKLAVAREHGADHLIDYSKDDLKAALKKLGGANVVFDPVGGELAEVALRAVKWEGRYLVIGFAAGSIPSFPLNLLLVKNIAALGVYWGAYMMQDPAVIGRSMAELSRWYGEGKLKPFVSHRFTLDQAPAAIAALAARKATGKVVVTMR